MMGDNRDNSGQPLIGFVPDENIVGRAWDLDELGWRSGAVPDRRF